MRSPTALRRSFLVLLTGCVGGTLLAISLPAHAEKTSHKAKTSSKQEPPKKETPKKETPKKEMETIYQKITASFLKKDPAVLAALLAPTLAAKTMDGKTQNREEWIKDTAEGFKNTKSVEAARFTVSGIKAKAEERTVDVVCKMAVTVIDADGRMGRRGKLHKLEQTIPSRDTWQKIKGKWLLTKWEERPGMKTVVDGKASAPDKPENR